MAREWALRGMSEDELRPDPKAQPPKTPRGKLENYWYHYKWHTIASIAVVVILTVMIGQMVTRDDSDYNILLATQNYISEAAEERLEASLEAYGKDLDGDGKIEVEIDTITLGGDTQMGMANQQKLIAHLAAGDVMFYIFDKETYETKIIPQENGDYRFLTKLDMQKDGIEGDRRYWNWKVDKLRDDPALKGLPQDLYFGIRSISGTSAKKSSIKMHNESYELLQAFLMKKPLTTPTTTPSATK